VDGVQNVQKVEQSHKVDQTQRTDKVRETSLSERVQPKPESSKAVGMMSHMFSELEKGQVHMDKLINMGMSGKEFSNGELLSLQAGMYKYTQELDLTSKVVEKATSGLKETLKTQV